MNVLRLVVRALRWQLARLRGFAPALVIDQRARSLDLVRLGSDYGGWTFVDDGSLADVVSCGLGEDASFDVEIASRCNARVVIVDPTPRALAHFRDLTKRLGTERGRGYLPGGRQPPESYDLRRVTASQLQMCECAVWVNDGTIKFYAPTTPTHVSFSAIAPAHGAMAGKPPDYIEVRSLALESIMRLHALDHIDLFKLDIEGAEIAVLTHMLHGTVRPRQLLVEYDELVKQSRQARDNVAFVHRQLLNAGYTLVHRESRNASYYRF